MGDSYGFFWYYPFLFTFFFFGHESFWESKDCDVKKRSLGDFDGMLLPRYSGGLESFLYIQS